MAAWVRVVRSASTRPVGDACLGRPRAGTGQPTGLLASWQRLRFGWCPATPALAGGFGGPLADLVFATTVDSRASVPVGAPRGRATGTPRPGRGTVEPGESVESVESVAADPTDLDGEDQVEDDHREVWRLVAAAQAGDGEAFGRLYDRYVEVVYRFLYYRVNDRALAEDFTSETFLRALRRISGVTYQGRDIGAWLITIARNIVLDHVKSARNRLEITTGDMLDGDEREPSTETAVLETLRSEHLMAAVARLGEEQRECVTLRFIQGLSVSETAQAMGKNDGAVKALQHRAVRKLAELIGDELL